MRFSYYKRPLFLVLAGWVAAILIFKFYGSAHFTDPFVPLPPSAVRLEGRIAQYPVHTRSSWRFPMDVKRMNGVSRELNAMAYARDMGGASYGDTVAFTAVLAEPFNYAIPGNLDWRAYLAQRGIRAEARGGRLEIINKACFPVRAAAALRAKALRIFEDNFSPDRASVLAGIVLGEKKSVSEELKSSFQDSGAMHLLVASGSNVGFVTFLVYFLCARLGLGKKISGPAALACAGFYVFTAGLEAPLVRAYIMFSAALCAYLLNRDSGIFQGLIIACLAILVIEPSALFDAGFQMSFIASYGITVGMGLWDGLIRFRGPARALLRVLMVSFFAQAGLYPLMALYFHKISLISIVSNVVLVPASGIIMGLGFSTLLVSGHGALFGPVKTAADLVLGAFIWLVKAFAAIEYSSLLVSPPSVLTLLSVFAFVLVFLHAPLLGFGRRRLYVLAAVPVLTFSAGGLLPEKSVIAVFSDPYTRSAIVRHGRKGIFLFNPGIGGRKLGNCALHYGSKELDGVFISTLERKNWSGLEELGKFLRVKRIILPYGPLPPELEGAVHKLSSMGTLVERAWPGEAISLGGVEAVPDWISGSPRFYGGAGYTGRARGEGLDWVLKSDGFDVAVMSGGTGVALRRGTGREYEQVIKNRPGEVSEIEI